MKKLLPFALAVAISGCANSEKVDNQLPVYLLLGQSNMVGMRSKVDDLPAALKETQNESLFFKDGKWLPLAPGVSEGKGFGPEISFSAEITKSKQQIGIIKLSAGATTLYKEWNPSVQNSLYRQTLALVDRAKETRNIKIAGVIWMQGESDGSTKEAADAYAKNLDDLISKFRTDLKSPDLPFSACRVTAPAAQFPFVETVRQAQMAEKATNYAWFDCDSLTKGPDSLHYDTAGQIRLGQMFAKSIQSIGYPTNGLSAK